MVSRGFATIDLSVNITRTLASGKMMLMRNWRGAMLGGSWEYILGIGLVVLGERPVEEPSLRWKVPEPVQGERRPVISLLKLRPELAFSHL